MHSLTVIINNAEQFTTDYITILDFFDFFSFLLHITRCSFKKEENFSFFTNHVNCMDSLFYAKCLTIFCEAKTRANKDLRRYNWIYVLAAQTVCIECYLSFYSYLLIAWVGPFCIITSSFEKISAQNIVFHRWQVPC